MLLNGRLPSMMLVHIRALRKNGSLMVIATNASDAAKTRKTAKLPRFSLRLGPVGPFFLHNWYF